MVAGTLCTVANICNKDFNSFRTSRSSFRVQSFPQHTHQIRIIIRTHCLGLLLLGNTLHLICNSWKASKSSVTIGTQIVLHCDRKGE